jgi:hypothetical protein
MHMVLPLSMFSYLFGSMRLSTLLYSYNLLFPSIIMSWTSFYFETKIFNYSRDIIKQTIYFVPSVISCLQYIFVTFYTVIHLTKSFYLSDVIRNGMTWQTYHYEKLAPWDIFFFWPGKRFYDTIYFYILLWWV